MIERLARQAQTRTHKAERTPQGETHCQRRPHDVKIILSQATGLNHMPMKRWANNDSKWPMLGKGGSSQWPGRKRPPDLQTQPCHDQVGRWERTTMRHPRAKATHRSPSPDAQRKTPKAPSSPAVLGRRRPNASQFAEAMLQGRRRFNRKWGSRKGPPCRR